MARPDRSELLAAVTGATSALGAADDLCRACIATLDVDGASLSLTYAGSTRGTFGSSDATSRHLDELQFTFGEGPCLDAVAIGAPVFAPDLGDAAEIRWPGFRDAVIESGVHAVFALPVALASTWVGALDLYRNGAGVLSTTALAGGLFAAELAALPLLDLIAEVEWSDAAEGGAWKQLASLERVEVYQATGMIVGALDVDPVEALVRLRAWAFAHGMTASEVAYAIVEGRVSLEGTDWREDAEG